MPDDLQKRCGVDSDRPVNKDGKLRSLAQSPDSAPEQNKNKEDGPGGECGGTLQSRPRRKLGPFDMPMFD